VATQAVSVSFGEVSVDVSIQLEGGELYQLALHLYQVRVGVRVRVRVRVRVTVRVRVRVPDPP